MKLFILILSFLFFSGENVKAEPMSSRIGHLYWGLGPNFGMMGNVRLGFGRVEIGVLQGTGFGLACINTMNRIFKLAIWAFILSLSLGFRVFTGEW